jgi:hypothetical protein
MKTKHRSNTTATANAASRIVMAGLALGLAALAPAWAADSIEDLERKLKAAREAKERREAEAARAEGARKAEAARAESARRAEESRQATLVVQSDAPCAFSVNGKQMRNLDKGITEVRVPAGQSLIACASTEAPGVSFEGELEARTGQNTVLRIQLAAAVGRKQEAQKAEAERAQEAQKAGAERAAKERAKQALQALQALQARWRGAGDVVIDTVTGLEWTQSDNGRDINWTDAQAYCQGKGGGWGLPTVEQLQSLYDSRLEGKVCWRYEGQSYKCKVSDHFALTGRIFWSSERNGSSEAWNVNLGNGERASYHIGLDLNVRALCVRRP